MLLLKRKTFEVYADTPLVKESEAGEIAKAGDVVAAAEAEALKIAEDAKVAYEAEKKRGYEDGIKAGKMEIMMQKLNLLEESVAYMESVEGKMSDLVLSAIRKCIGDVGSREVVMQLVVKAMQAIVRNQRQITIKVAPAMVESVKERLKVILTDFPSVTFTEVKEDPHLAETACVVETEAGLVEASVDGQLEALEKSIRKNFRPENG